MGPPRTSAVLLWSGVNAAAVLTAAAGVHFWPRHPAPPESTATTQLVAAQVVAAALLFPIALQDAGTALVNLALVACFQQLAGLLSATPPSRVAAGTVNVLIWTAGLAGWARLARTERQRSWGICVATLLSVGGAVDAYVAAEAAAQSGSPAPPLDRFGPVVAATSQTASFHHFGMSSGWFMTAFPLGSTAVLAIARIVRRSEMPSPLSATEPIRTS